MMLKSGAKEIHQLSPAGHSCISIYKTRSQTHISKTFLYMIMKNTYYKTFSKIDK